MIDHEVARDYPVVLTEWCSRCQRTFTDGDSRTIVIAHQPPFVGLTICPPCVDHEIDGTAIGVSQFLTTPRAHWGAPRVDVIPRPAAAGFVKVTECSDRRWRVGLKRGHVEVWTRDEIARFGCHERGSYSTDGQLFATGVRLPIRERRRVFVSLTEDSCVIWEGGSEPPVTQRYSALFIPPPPPIGGAADRKWMMAIEQQFAAMRYIRDHQVTPQSVGSNLQVSMLKNAEAYSWDLHTLTAVALASKTVPLSSMVPVTPPGHGGWWWFGITEMLPFVALLWSMHAGKAACLTIYGIDTQDVRGSFRPRPLRMTFWERADRLSEVIAKDQRTRAADIDLDEDHGSLSLPRFASASGDLADDVTRPQLAIALRFFTAGCTWLNQRILCLSSGHIERHRRKQLAREHEAPLPADVKVIQLRRLESSSRPPSAGAETVDWSCRWIVNGHWRHQPYKDERKLIYINPYVKGPDDKPLRVPTHTVYAVSR